MANCYSKPLTELEADLVDMYRILPESYRQSVFDLVHYKYTRLVDDGETSIRLINVFRHEQQALKGKHYLKSSRQSL